jgi:hypothetical protein
MTYGIKPKSTAFSLKFSFFRTADDVAHIVGNASVGRVDTPAFLQLTSVLMDAMSCSLYRLEDSCEAASFQYLSLGQYPPLRLRLRLSLTLDLTFALHL